MTSNRHCQEKGRKISYAPFGKGGRLADFVDRKSTGAHNAEVAWWDFSEISSFCHETFTN